MGEGKLAFHQVEKLRFPGLVNNFGEDRAAVGAESLR
jgi:hypothetical protein